MTDRRRQQQHLRAGLGLSLTGLAWNRSHRLAERLPGTACFVLFILPPSASSITDKAEHPRWSISGRRRAGMLLGLARDAAAAGCMKRFFTDPEAF